MANATMSKDEILEAIGNMSVFELADLIEAFKSKFNVTIAAAPVGGAAPAGGAGAAAPAVEEQTEFTVMLKEAGAKKIQVIKVVREITGLGPEGSEGSRRRRSAGREGRRVEGRSEHDQDQVGRPGRGRRSEVRAPARTGPRRASSRCLRRPRSLVHSDLQLGACVHHSRCTAPQLLYPDGTSRSPRFFARRFRGHRRFSCSRVRYA